MTGREPRANFAGAGPSRLAADYNASAAVPDEMVDSAGNVRPAWRDLVGFLEGLAPLEISARFARGDQYLRDAGVFYRHYGKGEVAVRDWPLSHVPVIIPEADFAVISAGLVQRAELLEALMADFYGENRLVANGDIPNALVGLNPHWLRPMVGVRPASGHYLHFIAVELGRGPDGRWWVLGDRTEAPSGAGFVLENRVATRRVFPDLFSHSNVHRLAGFFSEFRDALAGMKQPGGARPAILTPGSYTETYHEQAYIARYLGLSLLEGDDLAVENDRLFVRTIEGMRAVSVLWRRLDSAWCDPLELHETSRLGVPGLLDTVRAGAVSLVNALGSGILETQALLAFTPKLSETLLGAPLLLPNVATWWCGQEAEFQHVRRHADRMMISPAMSNRMAIELETDCAVAGVMRGESGQDVQAWLDKNRHGLVGQELVTLSTTPAFLDGRLEARPVSVRFFLARTAQGWEVMPGGFARVGARSDPSAIAMGKGGSVADVWVTSERPVAQVSLLGSGQQPFQRAAPAVLPSRAADNLFWLGRYVERAEGLLRLLRAYHGRLSEFGEPDVPILAALRDFVTGYGVEEGEVVPAALLSNLSAAISSAGHVRDRFSTDGWAALVDLSTTAKRLGAKVTAGDDAARAFGVLIRKLTGFSGLVHENMYQHAGWRFLAIGRALERAIGRLELMARFLAEDAPEGALELAIEVGDSVITHGSLYTVAARRDSVVDLLVLDAANPRALSYQIERIGDHAAFLPRYQVNGQLSPLGASIIRLRSVLATAAPAEVTPEMLQTLRTEMLGLSDLITTTYLG